MVRAFLSSYFDCSISKWIDQTFQKVFYLLGKNIATYPLLVICATMMVSFGLCSGIFFLEFETSPEKLWVPPNSRTAIEKNKFDIAFSPFFRGTF